MPQWCPSCSGVVRPGPDGDDRCPACGYCDPAGFDDEPPAGVAVEVLERPLEGPLGAALGLPEGRVLLLFGGPGTGKSTLAMQAMPGAAVLSFEQDATLVLAYRSRLRLPRTPCASLQLGELVEGRRAVVDVDLRTDDRVDGLVVDSVSMAPCEEVALMHFLAGPPGRPREGWAARTGQRVIVICHETKDGFASGPNALGHAAHAVVRLSLESAGRVIRVLKRRTGDSGHVVPFRLTADATPGRYYSVEGRTGHYALAEHPARGAEFAAPLHLWEIGRLELPPPPLAVAARTSRLGGEPGLLEPGDVAAREAFARSLGVPFFHPETAT